MLSKMDSKPSQYIKVMKYSQAGDQQHQFEDNPTLETPSLSIIKKGYTGQTLFA